MASEFPFVSQNHFGNGTVFHLTDLAIAVNPIFWRGTGAKQLRDLQNL
jgi:hypothetical protein